MGSQNGEFASLKKHERVAKACEECILIVNREEGIRVESSKRENEGIREVTDKYEVDPKYVARLIKKSKRTYQV